MRVYTDMCADLFHAGHVSFLRQCKGLESQDGVFLVVGIHSDATIQSYKRRPICTLRERVAVVAACRYVDEVVADAPLRVTKAHLREHKIDVVVHADGISEEAADAMYGEAIELGIYREVPRTPGISTSDLIARVSRDSRIL